jgi:hypothetical protein
MAAERDDDWAQKGLEHLQAAAREVIQATRTFLDAAEELVDDPKAVQGLMSTLGMVATAAASRLRSDGPLPGDDGDDEDGRVQPIQVS